ncbi:MAG TPA: hypothetical protein VK066_12320 [Chloroflexota bacterium]|nr:hypothetical protein [Chloroflexota bacterium]
MTPQFERAPDDGGIREASRPLLDAHGRQPSLTAAPVSAAPTGELFHQADVVELVRAVATPRGRLPAGARFLVVCEDDAAWAEVIVVPVGAEGSRPFALRREVLALRRHLSPEEIAAARDNVRVVLGVPDPEPAAS